MGIHVGDIIIESDDVTASGFSSFARPKSRILAWPRLVTSFGVSINGTFITKPSGKTWLHYRAPVDLYFTGLPGQLGQQLVKRNHRARGLARVDLLQWYGRGEVKRAAAFAPQCLETSAAPERLPKVVGERPHVEPR